MKPVGISILTNSNRRQWLERCINSLLNNCYYRPLIIAIFNNGATDDTAEWLRHNLPEVYGVTWRVYNSDKDRGCAWGTNKSIEMVDDCELQIHLESDFIHLPEELTNVDKMWLHRAVKHMENCDYLYLRRMRDEKEAAMHWWDQWMPKVAEEDKEMLKCQGFWWSNNPSLFRTQALKNAGVLPLNESLDGNKGTPSWSQPELQAGSPPRTYLHQWGMFVHEVLENENFNNTGCSTFKHGHTCKYGFWKDGKDKWCSSCDHSKNYSDMVEHRVRCNNNIIVEPVKVEAEIGQDFTVVSVFMNQETLESDLIPSLDGIKCGRSFIKGHKYLSIAKLYNGELDNASTDIVALMHSDIEFSKDAIANAISEIQKEDVGAVGLVGATSSGEVWSNKISESKTVESIDSCVLFVDRRKGFRFDDKTFDELHLYVEDFCYQVKSKGLKCVVVSADKFEHHSETYSSQGSCWGNYSIYKNRLTDKWGEVITT